ncbi:MAG TPA: ABC transporter permease [Mycobacteriales bacterium]|nr:ABC transporter permease [Mycobacteriales bacterium]
MLQYVLAGLALGAIYAIASASLVVTYVSAGILNFAFGSMAYVVARFYYWLNSQHGWGTDTAGALSLLVFAPVMGVVLYLLLFRHLRDKATVTKVVATIGVSVALPPLADLVFGTQTITSAPGLAALSDRPFHVFGTPITTDQVITYGFLIAVLVAGMIVLRYTSAGLQVQAVVDSQAMASLSGTNPQRVALGVWATSGALAGLAGILVAPTNGLDPEGMTTLMAAAFAVLVAARLTSLPGAVAIAMLMGVVTDVIQKYLPANSSFTAALIPSIPFAFMIVSLLIYAFRPGSQQDRAGSAGPLDAAIRPANQGDSASAEVGRRRTPVTMALGAVPLVAVVLMPLFFRSSSYWLGVLALGLCYSIAFLTFTLVTGEGGMLWLSQITFCGIGAVGSAQFATNGHLPVLLAILLAGLVAAVVGAIIGVLSIRLGDLYVALATLSLGLLVEGLVFTRNRFSQDGLGVELIRPSFITSDFRFAYFAIAVFLVLALLTMNLRRSTSGLALRAVRDSEPAARTLGLSIIEVKVLVGAIAAFVAAVGGAFIALDGEIAQPQEFAVFAGLAWLAVVATLGLRSISAAALAGVSFSLLPAIFATYVPTRWAEVPAILFGLGAISVARHPEGLVAFYGRTVTTFIGNLVGGRRPAVPSKPRERAAAP